MKGKCATAGALFGVLYIGQNFALTVNDPGDTKRDLTPKGAFMMATTTAGTTLGVDAVFITPAYVPNTITDDEEYPKPVAERPMLTIKSS